jgi:Uncharacterized protein conserved in bacteria
MTDIRPIRPIAIVGGGFSGAMLAARLAELGVASVVIDPSPRPGRGVAYGTPFDGHLLNVRAGRMSAVHGRPDDFVAWLQTHHPDRSGPEGFVPRRLYGDYVQDRLADVRARFPGLIDIQQGRVSRLAQGKVVLEDGRFLDAETVVLATGNPAPRTASKSGDPVIDRHLIRDPWADGALDAIGPQDSIAIIGTGLTMVDVVVWLLARGWRGSMMALSRRGLKPRSHSQAPEVADQISERIGFGPLSHRLKAARSQAGLTSWQAVMDGLRPLTADLWQSARMEERSRFLRHLRPWWDVHRHRIAPEIALQIDALMDSERLQILRGRVRAIEHLDPNTVGAPSGESLVLTFDLPRRIVPRGRIAQWIIDCSGPGHDPATDPLTGPLLDDGRVRLDPLGLGLDLDDQGRIIQADGCVNPHLLVIGPPARAAFWETIAVPDIRLRIEAMARLLTEAV